MAHTPQSPCPTPQRHLAALARDLSDAQRHARDIARLTAAIGVSIAALKARPEEALGIVSRLVDEIEFSAHAVAELIGGAE